MKRSEAIKIIRNIIDNLDDYDIKYYSHEHAIGILKSLEEVGMLPPTDRAEAVTNNIVYAYYPELVESNNDSGGTVNRAKLWEPEDE